MVRKSIATVILLLIFAVFLPSVSAQTSVTHEFSIQAYASTTVMVSFAYADNVTKSDVYCANRSLWRIETTPISVTFTTDAVDIFYFSITINYNIETNQTLLIDVYSGSQRAHTGGKLNVAANSVTLNFEIITAQEPHYPTAEELVGLIMERYPSRQDFQDWVNYQREQMNIVQQNLVTMWVVVGLNACTSIAAIIIVLYKPRRRERE
jgi:hypothetical protein